MSATLEASLRINEEHGRFALSLKGLRDLCSWYFDCNHPCQECNHARHASCQGLFPSYAHDILESVISHFENEENLMSEIGVVAELELHLLSHKKAHSQLLRELEGLVIQTSAQNAQGQTATAIRAFRQKTVLLLNEHANLFDDPLSHTLMNVGNNLKI